MTREESTLSYVKVALMKVAELLVLGVLGEVPLGEVSTNRSLQV